MLPPDRTKEHTQKTNLPLPILPRNGQSSLTMKVKKAPLSPYLLLSHMDKNPMKYSIKMNIQAQNKHFENIFTVNS